MFNLARIPVPNLGGKSILVTGSGRGIGAYLVEILVERGATVFAGVYGQPDSDSLKRLEGAVVLPLDVTRDDQVNSVVETISKATGRLDVLVNNAGIIAPIGHLADLESDALLPTFEVNVIGLHRMTRAALGLLKRAKGTIVNAGTGAATTPMEGWTAYCTSKAAARMLTEMFALELAESGIRSFFIGIPPTDTDMQASIRQSGLNPISKIAQSDLVPAGVPASVMAWLCSDAAKKVKETILDVRDNRFVGMMNR